MIRKHTDRTYEAELQQLRERILLMAGTVEEMIARSVRALVDGDAELARRTIEIDGKVNLLERETDELCLLILAKRQPLGSDLRFITLALKMVTDLERIGDLAVNICERAIDLSQGPRFDSFADITRMAEIAQQMVTHAIDAFVRGDADRAQQVLDRDDELDELYHHVFRQILAQMLADPSLVERGIHVQSVAKVLERIGDHGTNLAEAVVFMVNGTDIRHQGKLDSI
ncbi:MAG: phosphate signaling complex protein PhoU [Deltaproteobacteria bacterium]|nr:phosphate signaling complex protein PhoU [Deltaproteobacteria bacterium]